jgi:hypothetical protein
MRPPTAGRLTLVDSCLRRSSIFLKDVAVALL